MGHRERLMAGAKRCLDELGYARTTARDIAAASNANLARSPTTTAPRRPCSTPRCWRCSTAGEPTSSALRPPRPATIRPRGWSGAGHQVIDSFTAHRPMLLAAVEAQAQAEHMPEVREGIADAYERSRPQLGAEVYGIDSVADEAKSRAAGSIHMALIAGISQQWLVDPDRAPSGAEIVLGLRAVLERLESAGRD